MFPIIIQLNYDINRRGQLIRLGGILVTNEIIRDTWAEVNLDHIYDNIIAIKNKLQYETQIIAVVKANGYGHGSVQVARVALEAGASALAVALLEEALILRNAFTDIPILVLGRVPARFAPLAAEKQITLTFFQAEWLSELTEYTFENPVQVHMKWDTGMGRIGLRTESELKHVLETLKETPQALLTGVYTHFASADEDNLSYFHTQNREFEQMVSLFKQEWSDPESVAFHTGNSAASIRFPELMYNYIRFGISMYGLYPSKEVKAEEEIKLKQAFSLHSKLVHVKKIAPGETVSYGQTYTAEKDEWIGTLPIGYGDGWIRKLQGFHVLIDGKYVPIVGRICMDMTMIRLDREYDVGTKVTLIGQQQNEIIRMDDVADYLETINYEIPCILNERIPRIYTKGK